MSLVCTYASLNILSLYLFPLKMSRPFDATWAIFTTYNTAPQIPQLYWLPNHDVFISPFPPIAPYTWAIWMIQKGNCSGIRMDVCFAVIKWHVRDWTETEGSWFKPRYQQTMEGILVVGTRITRALPRCPWARYWTPKCSHRVLDELETHLGAIFSYDSYDRLH